MELSTLRNRVAGFVKKYRFVMIVIAAGLLLMLIPGNNKSAVKAEKQISQKESETAVDPQNALASVLSQVKGAGKVQVYLTTMEGEKIVYQSNTDKSGENIRTETVTITTADRGQEGLISQVNPPVYLGAIVVCEGADNPTVQLAIVDAVSKGTGLGTNRISVLKMK